MLSHSMCTWAPLVTAIALSSVACSTGDGGGGGGGSTSSSSSTTSGTSSGGECVTSTSEWHVDGSCKATASCGQKTVSVSCGQVGVSTFYHCSCAVDGAVLGDCTGYGGCDVPGSCCDKYFFAPAGCKADGEPCGATEECCYSVCSSLGTCGCLAEGSACQSSSDCCENNCDATTGTCVAACKPQGGYCVSDAACCSGKCHVYYAGCQ